MHAKIIKGGLMLNQVLQGAETLYKNLLETSHTSGDVEVKAEFEDGTVLLAEIKIKLTAIEKTGEEINEQI